MDPTHMSWGGVVRGFPWQCSRKGQNQVGLCLELECPCYTVSGVTDSGEEGMRANVSLVLCLLLSVQILFCLKNDLFCLLTWVMHRQPV